MAERLGASRQTTAVVEPEEELLDEVLPGGGASNPLYPVALLKVAMAMKRLDSSEEAHLESLLDEVMGEMVIDRAEFREYMQRNMGRLMAAVRFRGY